MSHRPCTRSANDDPAEQPTAKDTRSRRPSTPRSTGGRGWPWTSLRLRGAALAALLHAAPAAADEPPAAEASEALDDAGAASDAAEPADLAPDDAELTDEELRMLLESLGADAAERAGEAGPSAQPSSFGRRQSGTGGTTTFQDMNPDISLILDFAIGWFSAEDPIQTGAHDPNRTGFTLQQFEIAMTSTIDPYFHLVGTLVFNQFGVELEEAYGETLGLGGGLSFRMGQIMTKFGRLNNTHPHSWKFTDQPLANGRFLGGESARGLGVEGSWLVPLPWYVMTSVSATDAAGACCARSFFGGTDLGVRGFGDVAYTGRVEQFFPFGSDWSLLWGVSGMYGPNSTGNGNNTVLAATDLYLRWRPRSSPVREAVTWTLEAMHRQRQVPDDVLVHWGGYTQVVWNVNLRWETGVRWEYVTGIEGDDLDPEWDRDTDRLSAQVTYYPSHFSRLRLQGARTDARWREEVDYSAVLAVEFVAGAHGAHSY